MDIDASDLAAWYRADQETAVAVYGGVDSATLAALLPAVDAEIARAQETLATWQRHLREGNGVEAALLGQRDEVRQAIRSRVDDDPAWQDLADQVDTGLRSAIDDLRARASGSSQRLVDVALVQALALAQRRQLMRVELQRRGLLPDLPPHADDLDDNRGPAARNMRHPG